MQIYLSLILSFLFINFGFAQDAYFYLDTGCEQCALEEVSENRDYWVISSEVYTAPLDEYEQNKVLTQFKQQIQNKWGYESPLLDQITIRYQSSLDLAKAARKKKMEKMIGKGYEMIEFNFDLEVHNKISSIESYLRKLEAYGFDGSVLLSKEGEALHEGYYGLAKAEPLVHWNSNMVFPIASVSKVITAHAILLLEEQGLLNTTDSLSAIFEDVPDDKMGVTIHHLLSHSSGMAREYLPASRSKIFEMALKHIMNKPLAFKPGERYNYSNTAFDLLALIIEKVSGMSYESFVETQIFKKIQVTSLSHTYQSEKKELLVDGSDEWAYFPFSSPESRQYALLGAGSIRLTMKDLWNYFNALQNGSLLPAKQFDKMMKLVTPTAEQQGYGYGFKIDNSRKEIIAEGDYEGFHTTYKWLPEEEISILIFSNQDFYRFGVHRRIIANDLLKLFNREQVEAPSSPISLNRKALNKLCGTYVSSTGDQVQIQMKYDRLKFYSNDQSVINSVIPIDENKFAQLENWNTHVQELIPLLEKKDFPAFAKLLKAGNPDFFAERLKKQIASYEDQYQQSLTKIDFLTTIPFPWQSPNFQSILLLHFGERVVDLSLVWQANGLYENVTELGIRNTLVRTLVPVSDNSLSIYDLVKKHEVQLIYSKDYYQITLDGKDFFKVQEQ